MAKIRIRKKELLRLYWDKGKSINKIARLYNCDSKTIWNRMKEFKISPRPPSESRMRYKKKDFSGDLIEKAYLLGFRMGDLNVYQTTPQSKLIVARCNTTQRVQIDLLKKIFSKYGKMTVSNGKDSFNINCFLNDTFDFLIPNDKKVPNWINKQIYLSAAFIAGYVDAEGSFGLGQSRARFKLDSYDFDIQEWIFNKLLDLDINAKFRLIARKGTTRPNGKKFNHDLWRLEVNEGSAILSYVNLIKPFIKHKTRYNDMTICLINVQNRIKMEQFLIHKIRNFAIIAHVDHGKSTLADRMLELTGTVAARDMQSQLLDSNPIERERGITIKLAPVRMVYQNHILNLIDTPGHVDFAYEVSRSLTACEGAVLLVDATQGVQAQTLAHFHLAQKLGLVIVPVVNKIDVNTADISGTIAQMQEIMGFTPEEILQVSGKTGQGVPELLESVIKRIPAPNGATSGVGRALVFNSNFDLHLGVIAWIRVVDGEVRMRDKLFLLGTGVETQILEVGVFTPGRKQVERLGPGEVGYVVSNLKDISQLTMGDTLANDLNTRALPGYNPIKPVVFMSLYPTDGGQINLLRDGLSKLRLADSSLVVAPEFSPALGNGFRVGFLGLLHADVVQERLEREFDLTLIAAAPSVSYQILTTNSQLLTISKPQDLPDPSQIKEIREPILSLSIFTPQDFVGPITQLSQNHRGQLVDMVYSGRLVHMSYRLPLSELIKQFYDQLKSVSQGFATLDYELVGFEAADLAKLDVLVAGEKVDALSQIVPRSLANTIGNSIVSKLKDIIPRQNFEVAIQAAMGGHILARADVKAFRKDVIAKLSGGDQTRKDKLLKKQKKGKTRMKRVGKIDLPQEAFLSILKV